MAPLSLVWTHAGDWLMFHNTVVLGGKHNTNPRIAGAGGDRSRAPGLTEPEKDGAAPVTETWETRFART